MTFGRYVLGVVLLAATVGSAGFGALRLLVILSHGADFGVTSDWVAFALSAIGVGVWWLRRSISSPGVVAVVGVVVLGLIAWPMEEYARALHG